MDRPFFSERKELLPLLDILGDFADNEKRILNISMPTRLGKTYIATLFSVWLLLKSKGRKRILRASYSATLAAENSKQTKDIFFKFFEKCELSLPDVIGTSDRWRVAGSEPNIIGCGYEGSITGFGVDVGIFDDMSKNLSTAVSAAYDTALDNFLQSVVYGRLENERKIINVGTRWTANDWFSKFNPDIEFVLPALIDGQSCCESWKSTAEILIDQERVNEHIFAAQWMQSPTLQGRYRLFADFKPEIINGDFSDWKKYVVIDPSQQVGSDYFVCGYYGVKQGLVCLLDVYAKADGNIYDVCDWLRAHPYRLAYCESNGNGAGTINSLIKKGLKNIAPFSTIKDKYSRAGIVYSDIFNYFRVSDGCPQIDTLIQQAQDFPTGEFDDIIDNVVMAFEHLPVKFIAS